MYGGGCGSGRIYNCFPGVPFYNVVVRFITWITFKWEYFICRIATLMVWIVICTKLRVYKLPLEPVKFSCQGFGVLWR